MSVELVNEVGVDAQITNQRMVLGEAECLLLGGITEEPPKIFKAVSAALKCFAAGGIDRACRMALDQSAQAHNRA
jgi:hypothetical protein